MPGSRLELNSLSRRVNFFYSQPLISRTPKAFQGTMDSLPDPKTSIEAVERGLAQANYIASRQIATAVYLGQKIDKPILVEGPAGVGKTELAKSIAAWLNMPLIRMQCYEGLDESKALYEWKYGKQLLYTQILKDKIGEVLGGTDDAGRGAEQAARLRRRVLLQGIPRAAPAAAGAGAAGRLRAADRRDRQGRRTSSRRSCSKCCRTTRSRSPRSARIVAEVTPIVILTSNSRARSGRRAEAPLPAPAHRLPRAEAGGAHHRHPRARHRGQPAQADRCLRPEVRTLDLKKLPSVSRDHRLGARDAAAARSTLETDLVRDTLNVLLKFEIDMESVAPQISEMIDKASRAHVPD